MDRTNTTLVQSSTELLILQLLLLKSFIRHIVLLVLLGGVAFPAIAQLDSLHLELSQLKTDKERVELYIELAKSYRLSNLDSSFYYSDLALELAEANNDSNGMLISNHELGVFYRQNEEKHKALEHALMAKEYFSSASDSNILGSIALSSGHIYSQLRSYDQANSNYKQALQVFKAVDNVEGICYTLSGLGALEQNFDHYDKALRYYLEALSAHGPERSMIRADIESNIGVLYLNVERYEDGLTYLEKVLSYYDAENIPSGQNIANVNLGEAHLKLKQWDLALLYYRQAIDAAEAMGSPGRKLSGLKGIAKAYESKGEFKQSLEYFKMYHALKDSLHDHKQVERLEELETQLAAKEREVQLQLTNSQLQESQNELAESRSELLGSQVLTTWLWVGIGALLGISVLGVYLIRLNKINNKSLRNHQQTILEKNTELNKTLVEKEVLLKEIHHRVKNNLQIISSLLNLQSRALEDEHAIAVLREGQSRIHAIALIHQKLYQNKNLAEIDIEGYINDLINQQQFALEASGDLVRYEVHTKGISLNLDTAVPIGLILSELISNAHKHAFKGVSDKRIFIHLSELTGMGKFQLTLRDNGNGFEPDFDPENSESLGIEIVKALSEQLEGEMHWCNEDGARIDIYFEEVHT